MYTSQADAHVKNVVVCSLYHLDFIWFALVLIFPIIRGLCLTTVALVLTVRAIDDTITDMLRAHAPIFATVDGVVTAFLAIRLIRLVYMKRQHDKMHTIVNRKPLHT